MDLLKDFHQAADHPAEYAREIKNQGRKIIGYFCSYTPEELIYAAGAHPMRLFGTKGEIRLADSHLQSYCCSLVRSALEEALTGRLNFLDGTVFPHTCDSIQRLSDIWRLNTAFGFFSDVVLPVKLDTDSARQYFKDVLAGFKRELEKALQTTISDEALWQALRKYETIRGYLKTIYDLRAQDPGLIESRHVLALVKGSMVMDRDRLTTRLPEVITAMTNRDFEWEASGHKRLILAGGLCEHPEVHDCLENAGGAVVGDDMCLGSRWFDRPVINQGDPLSDLSDSLIQKAVCPAKHASITHRGEQLVRLVRDRQARGVLFLHLKFCDPHAFDYPYLKEFLDRENIPSLLFEIEEQLPSQAQMETRLETFIQML